MNNLPEHILVTHTKLSHTKIPFLELDCRAGIVACFLLRVNAPNFGHAQSRQCNCAIKPNNYQVSRQHAHQCDKHQQLDFAPQFFFCKHLGLFVYNAMLPSLYKHCQQTFSLSLYITPCSSCLRTSHGWLPLYSTTVRTLQHAEHSKIPVTY